MLGHLPAHPELLSALAVTGIKVLLMVRDPRDMIVSYVKYVTKIDLTHPAHAYFKALPDDDARIMAAIKGVEGVVSPVSETLEKFSGWLDSGAMVIRFENIIGANGGGSDIKQREVVGALADFIGVQIGDEKLTNICRDIYSPKAITFRKPQIGGWKTVLGDNHLGEIEMMAGELMRRYGYSV